jgi:hypothetical protein
MHIDVSFDFQTDAGGKDPDIHSAMLRKYHKFLWSKPLPCGRTFILDDTRPGLYLHHSSELGEFELSSDSAIATFNRYKRMKHIIEMLDPDECQNFLSMAYTIGGMILFPSNKINGKLTINGARGLNSKIADRFDLTLECIRRYYSGGESPLADTLARYSEFFALFVDFRGYVDFFILQDLVDSNCESVAFFLPFDSFNASPLPTDIGAYIDYRRCSREFITARNSRIHAVAATMRGAPKVSLLV